MPIKDTGCLLTTGIPVYPSFRNWKERILACGTVRANRKFLPKEIVAQQNEQVRRLKKRGFSLSSKQQSNMLHVERQEACSPAINYT